MDFRAAEMPPSSHPHVLESNLSISSLAVALPSSSASNISHAPGASEQLALQTMQAVFDYFVAAGMTMQQVQRRFATHALKANKNNLTATADMLAISETELAALLHQRSLETPSRNLPMPDKGSQAVAELDDKTDEPTHGLETIAATKDKPPHASSKSAVRRLIEAAYQKHIGPTEMVELPGLEGLTKQAISNIIFTLKLTRRFPEAAMAIKAKGMAKRKKAKQVHLAAATPIFKQTDKSARASADWKQLMPALHELYQRGSTSVEISADPRFFGVSAGSINQVVAREKLSKIYPEAAAAIRRSVIQKSIATRQRQAADRQATRKTIKPAVIQTSADVQPKYAAPTFAKTAPVKTMTPSKAGTTAHDEVKEAAPTVSQIQPQAELILDPPVFDTAEQPQADTAVPNRIIPRRAYPVAAPHGERRPAPRTRYDRPIAGSNRSLAAGLDIEAEKARIAERKTQELNAALTTLTGHVTQAIELRVAATPKNTDSPTEAFGRQLKAQGFLLLVKGMKTVGATKKQYSTDYYWHDAGVLAAIPSGGLILPTLFLHAQLICPDRRQPKLKPLSPILEGGRYLATCAVLGERHNVACVSYEARSVEAGLKALNHLLGTEVLMLNRLAVPPRGDDCGFMTFRGSTGKHKNMTLSATPEPLRSCCFPGAKATFINHF